MGDFTIFSPDFFVFVGNFAPIIIVIAVFCFGEFAVLSAFIMASQDYVSLPVVFVAALIGTLSADLFWFGAGRLYPGIRKTKIYTTIGAVYRKQEQFFLRHPGLILFAIKYVYGFRWSTIIFYSSTAMIFRKYFFLDCIGSVSYVVVLGIVGYHTGLGIYNLVGVYGKITHALFAVVLALIAMFTVRALGRLVFKKMAHILE